MNFHKVACLLLLALIISIVAIPQFADARAGGGRSSGSRGTHTYSSTPGAQPINRSTTAPQNTAPSPSQPGASGGSPFLRSLAGAFLGVGLASLLFGGLGGGSGMGLLPLLLIGGVAYFIYKRIKSQGLMPTATSNVAQAPINSQPISISDTDKAAFEQLLYQVQQAWSEGDITRLRQFVTPEMVHYFSEELSANSSRGLANKMEQVKLQQADIMEAWNEYDMDYATAKLNWTALDYLVRLDRQPVDNDYVESGSITEPQVAEEFWTFVRASGGRWLLSAIQQTETT